MLYNLQKISEINDQTTKVMSFHENQPQAPQVGEYQKADDEESQPRPNYAAICLDANSIDAAIRRHDGKLF